jgi:hypothetical protein
MTFINKGWGQERSDDHDRLLLNFVEAQNVEPWIKALQVHFGLGFKAADHFVLVIEQIQSGVFGDLQFLHVMEGRWLS